MGLFVGASVLTLFEFIDVIVYNYALRKKEEKRIRTQETRHLNIAKQNHKTAIKPNGRFLDRSNLDTFV